MRSAVLGLVLGIVLGLCAAWCFFVSLNVSAATRNALGLVDDDDDAGIDSGCDRSSCRFGGVLHSACLQFLPIMSLQPNFG